MMEANTMITMIIVSTASSEMIFVVALEVLLVACTNTAELRVAAMNRSALIAGAELAIDNHNAGSLPNST